MSEIPTLDALTVPLRALRLLAVDFGHLPGPEVRVSTIIPDALCLAWHETTMGSGQSLTAFEQWREALGIEPDAVEYRTQAGGLTTVLLASGTYGGATVELTAYAASPQAANSRTGVSA
ncbi:hypothetical protein [Streptomyces sp. NP-1717]|uniref:hypothetical protein n=1 Tax=Streptomyces sp. NP-1717 TaxID=2704470 RepID=UPI001F5D3208|nr:hypothetical protein [Streptomyces sp. NP-1717]MCI3225832.1 hypothetical protein [Streptomyces sp. NP-1717]